MVTAKKSSTKKRPTTLDKRVFFGDDFPGLYTIRLRNLLYLHVRPRPRSVKYKWEFEFDILDSGRGKVAFTKEEFKTIIQLFESKPFDWGNRCFSDFPSFLWYRYLTLDDAIAVANRVAEVAYRLHNDPLRSVSVDVMRQQESGYQVHIYDEKNGQYQLSADGSFRLEILLFKNGRTITKRGSKALGLIKGYPREKAIANYNPKREDGVLLINHNVREAEFFRTDWNTFCLQVDRRVFPKE